MKPLLLIVGAILLSLLIGWAVYDPDTLRHKTIGYSEQERKAAQNEADQTQFEILQKIDAQKLEEEIKLVELRRGEAAGATYRLCHTYPPTTKENQLKCKRIDEQARRDDERADKHPW